MRASSHLCCACCVNSCRLRVWIGVLLGRLLRCSKNSFCYSLSVLGMRQTGILIRVICWTVHYLEHVWLMFCRHVQLSRKPWTMEILFLSSGFSSSCLLRYAHTLHALLCACSSSASFSVPVHWSPPAGRSLMRLFAR